MGTDHYTPLSGALWDYLGSQLDDEYDVEDAHAEIMDRIVERVSV